MLKIAKCAIVGLLYGMGLTFFFVGVVTQVYSTSAGLIIMMIFWCIACLLMYSWKLVNLKYYDDWLLLVHIF